VILNWLRLQIITHEKIFRFSRYFGTMLMIVGR
jgi:hypothetical protein